VTWWSELVSAAAGSAATWGALVLTGRRNRADNALALIGELRQRVDQLEDRVVEAEGEARAAAGHARQMENYAAELREQIYRGEGPPPSPWPVREA